MLKKFAVEVVCKPESTNVGADAMSRWAYPACKAFNDCSMHGSAEDATALKELEDEEEQERWEDYKNKYAADDEENTETHSTTYGFVLWMCWSPSL